MRLWLRRKRQKLGKHYALHELANDGAPACGAVVNRAHYNVTGKAYEGERICAQCQRMIAARRGRL